MVFALGIESQAEAAFLKNGARPGAGDRLQTIKPPRAGARKRIYAPGERPAAGRPGNGSKPRRRQEYKWFWQAYSTGLAAASDSRWADAIETLNKRNAEQGRPVDPEPLLAIDFAYDRQIAAAAAKHNVSEALLMAVIYVESRGKSRAVSPKGAQGLMQLIPATAKRFGVTNPYDVAQNVNGGAAYLNWLLKEFRGDPLLALAGYNAGEGAVRKHKGVPPFAETRDYVVKVMDAVATLKTRCKGGVPSPRSPCEIVDSSG